MQLVDKSNRDIQAGYQRILDAEYELLRDWRDPLLEAYSQLRSTYEEEQQKFRQRRSEFLSRIRIGIWLSSAILVLGLIVLPLLLTVSELGDLRGPLLCFAPILILGGITGWAIVAVLWIWQRDQVKPVPPPHPLKMPLLPPLTDEWKIDLHGKLLVGKPEKDDEGIYSFIARLQTIEPDAYILHGLRLDHDGVVDITIIGPRGIWVFEIIHREGVIRWREGRWTQRRTSYRISGHALTEIHETEGEFDRQWQKSMESVILTIQDTLPDLVKNVPNVIKVRGGLVFSHRKVRIDIPPGCPFNWGIIPFWLNKLVDVPPVLGFDEPTIFNIIDALVTKHQQISDESSLRSMLDAADNLVEQGEERLREYLATANSKSK